MVQMNPTRYHVAAVWTSSIAASVEVIGCSSARRLGPGARRIRGPDRGRLGSGRRELLVHAPQVELDPLANHSAFREMDHEYEVPGNAATGRGYSKERAGVRRLDP